VPGESGSARRAIAAWQKPAQPRRQNIARRNRHATFLPPAFGGSLDIQKDLNHENQRPKHSSRQGEIHQERPHQFGHHA
jgi:hypothetical protein